MRSRASSFNWQYPLLSLRSSRSFLRLLPHLLVTSISPFIFPSITCCRRQFLRKMWAIHLAFHFLISCRIFLCSMTLSNISSFLTWSVQLIFSILLQHHTSKFSRRYNSYNSVKNLKFRLVLWRSWTAHAHRPTCPAQYLQRLEFCSGEILARDSK